MAGSSDWITHVDVFVDPDGREDKQAASRDFISKLLLNRTITLQQLVLVAGKYLTSNDNAIRARGLLLLAELLHDLAQTPMEDTAIHSLATFFSDRLQDWHSLRPALMGSIALLERQRRIGSVHPEDVEKIGKSVVEQVDVQALSQRDRMLSLELYECLLTLHGSSVRSLGSDFVLGIIAAIDGEADARCTLVAFRLVEQLVALFPDSDGPFKEHVMDIFDILNCYFPIKYNSPPDVRGITKEDLSSALLKAFTATPLFAPFCFPEFLRKLSSTLQTAKLDALNYMGYCAISYGPEAISEFAGDIWLGLKSEVFRLEYEVLDQKDTQIREEVYSCLTRCIQASQKGKRMEDEVMDDLLKLVLEDEDVVDFLRRVKIDANQQTDFGSGVTNLAGRTDAQSRAVERILGAAARASSGACYAVAKVFFSFYLPSVQSALKSSDYQLCESASARENFVSEWTGVSVTGLEGVLHIVEGARHLAHSLVESLKLTAEDSASKKWLGPIVLAAPPLIHAFTQVVAGRVVQEVIKPGVAGLQALATFPAALSPLSEDQLETVLTFLSATFLDKSKGSDVKDQALDAILAASNLEEESHASSCQESSSTKDEVNVLSIVVPKLLGAVGAAQSSEDLKSYLHALAALSKSRKAVRLRVLKAFGNVISDKLDGTLVSADRNFEFAKVVLILRSLSGYIIPLCEIGSVDQRVACDIVIDIWRTVGSLSQPLVHMASDIFLPLMAVIRITVQKCPQKLQEEILAMGLSVLQRKNSSAQNFEAYVPRALNGEFMDGREWCVALIGSVIVGLLPSVVFGEREMLLRLFVNTSVGDMDPFIMDVAAQAAASLLNKWHESKPGIEQESRCSLNEAIVIAVDEGWMPILGKFQSEVTRSLLGSSCPETAEEVAARSVYALALAGKGLAMRGHPRTVDIAGVMLRILHSQSTRTTNSGRPETVGLVGVCQCPVGKAAVESFGIIVKEHASFLSRSQNAIIRPLYKQRFFTSMLSPLTETVHLTGNQSSRVWFYRAFASLLSGTPVAAALTEGKRVLPLVLEGLSTLGSNPQDSGYLLQMLLALSSFLVDDDHAPPSQGAASMVERLRHAMQTSSLGYLKMYLLSIACRSLSTIDPAGLDGARNKDGLCSSGRSIAAEYVQSMVNRLIPLTQYKLSMVVRESALQCLAAIVGLSFTRVFPVKSQVMKAITAALDDKKRLVRKEAIRCRQVWSAISSK